MRFANAKLKEMWNLGDGVVCFIFTVSNAIFYGEVFNMLGLKMYSTKTYSTAQEVLDEALNKMIKIKGREDAAG